jgi:hypothetical protein
VRLVPGPAPTGDVAAALAAAQRRYGADLPLSSSAVATAAGVPRGDLRRDLTAERVGSDQLRIVADAAAPSEAEALAIRAASGLVEFVPQDQARTVTTPGDRLTALVSGYVTRGERTKPSDTLAVLVGVAAGLAVLLLAGCLALLARGRED